MIEVEAKDRARQSKELLSESTGERLPGQAPKSIRSGRAPQKYGWRKKIDAKPIVLSGAVQVPPEAQQLKSTLNARTPQHKS
jgi:hypothetical protein